MARIHPGCVPGDHLGSTRFRFESRASQCTRVARSRGVRRSGLSDRDTGASATSFPGGPLAGVAIRRLLERRPHGTFPLRTRRRSRPFDRRLVPPSHHVSEPFACRKFFGVRACRIAQRNAQLSGTGPAACRSSSSSPSPRVFAPPASAPIGFRSRLSPLPRTPACFHLPYSPDARYTT